MNIRAPMSTFSGRIGGLEFTRGNATGDLSEEQVAWFRARGYVVEEETPESDSEPTAAESDATPPAAEQSSGNATAESQPAPSTPETAETAELASQPATEDAPTDEASLAPARRAGRRSTSAEDTD